MVCNYMKPGYIYGLGMLLLMLVMGLKCKPPVDDPTIDFKYDYFPLKVGHTYIYDVDSVTYDDFTGRVDTVNYQLRMFFESTFLDSENRIAYRIEVNKRNTDQSNWEAHAVWFANRTASTAERVEDNLRFINMTFPPKLDKTWNGNGYLDIEGGRCLADYDDWEFTYIELDQPKTVNNILYDSTLTVEQINDTTENLLEMQFSFETYAKNIGLIEKEFWSLETQIIVTEPWAKKAQCGFILKMRLNSFIP